VRLQAAIADPLRPLAKLLLCGVLGFAIAGMPLAMLGVFRPLPVVIGGALMCAVLWAIWGPASATRIPRLAATAALIVVLVPTGVNAKYQGQHLLNNKDPAVYVITARWIAREGNLKFDNSIAAFGQNGDLYYEAPGFYLAESHPEYAEPQFLHLLPALMAIGEWLGGLFLMFKVPALIGGMALLAVYLFATRVLGPWWAVGATAGLAVSLPAVYFSRDSYSEMLSMLFLFGGLWLLWEARDKGSRRLHFIAGLALGATAMARIDALFYLIPLAAYLLIGPRLASAEQPAHGGWRMTGPLVAGVTLTTGLGLADVALFAPQYLDDLPQVRTIALGLAAVVGAGAALWAISRIRAVWKPPPHLKRGLVAALLVATAVILAALNWNRPWLAWYLGTVTVAAALVGLVLLAPLGRQRRVDWYVAPFLAIFAATAMVYLYRPNVTIEHIFAIRRFLPVVLPGMLILAFVVVDRLWRAGAARGTGIALRAGAVALAIALVALPARKTAPVADVAPQAGMGDVTERACRTLPPNAAVLVLDEAGVPFYRHQYLHTIRAFCDVPTAGAPVNADLVRQVAAQQATRGRRLFVIDRDGNVAGLAPPPGSPHIGEVIADLRPVADAVPTDAPELPVAFHIFEVPPP
jgi:hypothetical protein